ncbi:hypothetical protein MK657_004976 [Escherichia coli]|nr:hypothetical protein [Escherichia coli]
MCEWPAQRRPLTTDGFGVGRRVGMLGAVERRSVVGFRHLQWSGCRIMVRDTGRKTRQFAPGVGLEPKTRPYGGRASDGITASSWKQSAFLQQCHAQTSRVNGSNVLGGTFERITEWHRHSAVG